MEDHYKPFLSHGFVSLNDSSEALPVQISRDTGAAQTLLLEGPLPLSEQTFTGRSVLLQGVELGVIDVPLHKIYLKSDLNYWTSYRRCSAYPSHSRRFHVARQRFSWRQSCSRSDRL